MKRALARAGRCWKYFKVRLEAVEGSNNGSLLDLEITESRHVK